ncbi:MAG: glutamate racemase, partial [Lentisphaerae bacterium]|nr:glutamate racemase [Lentisphaerota bacterium]
MSQRDNRPIGVFDSGLGGLTVVSALIKRFPSENFIYLGDTARVPYGGKSVKSLMEFARQDAAFLLSKDVKLVIAACNTVSSVAMPALR